MKQRLLQNFSVTLILLWGMLGSAFSFAAAPPVTTPYIEVKLVGRVNNHIKMKTEVENGRKVWFEYPKGIFREIITQGEYEQTFKVSDPNDPSQLVGRLYGSDLKTLTVSGDSLVYLSFAEAPTTITSLTLESLRFSKPSTTSITQLNLSRLQNLEFLKCNVSVNYIEGLSKNWNYSDWETTPSLLPNLKKLYLTVPTSMGTINMSNGSLEYVELIYSATSGYLHFDKNNVYYFNLSWLNALSHLEALTLSKNSLNSLTLDLSKEGRIDYLNLSENNISSFQDLHFGTTPHLSFLDLSRSKISDVNLDKDWYITTLDLNYNKINSIDLIRFKDLQRLFLVDVGLSSIDLSSKKDLTGLDLSWNRFSSLDLSELSKLEELYLNGNKIRRVSLNHLHELRRLALDSNPLESLDLSALSALTHLSLSFTSLDSINLEGLSQLESLALSSNRLSKVSLSDLTKLKKLNLSYNAIKSLDLSNLTELETLELGNNPLETLNLSNCGELRTLALQNASLKSISLKGLDKLWELDLQGNNLTKIDLLNLNIRRLNLSNNSISEVDWSKLTMLSVLNLSNNPITSVELNYRFNHLDSLYLSHTGIKYFHAGGDIFPNLKFLDLSHTPVTSVNLSGNGYYPQPMVDLTRLYLNYCGLLQSLELDGLDRLEALTLSHSKVQNLNLSNLPRLWGLSLAGNDLTTVDLTNLPGLTWLGLSDNNLSSINLSYLTNLHTLYLNKNPLKSINFNGLSSIKRLYLYNCNIEEIDLSFLSNLQILSLSSNRIQNVNLSNLTNLVVLLLDNNKLEQIDLTSLPYLQTLNLSHNKLRSLDLSKNLDLKWLYLAENKLTSLDLVSNHKLQDLVLNNNSFSNLPVINSPLERLYVENNKIRNMDLSSFTTLFLLDASDNALESITFSPDARYLTKINLAGNPISTKSLDALYSTLPPFVRMRNSDPQYGQLILLNEDSDAAARARVEATKGKTAIESNWRLYELLSGETEAFDVYKPWLWRYNPTKEIITSSSQDPNSGHPPTAVESLLLASVKVAPNPFAAEIRVVAAENVRSYELVSISGRVERSGIHNGGSEMYINTDQIPIGVYLLRLHAVDGDRVFRLVKP